MSGKRFRCFSEQKLPRSSQTWPAGRKIPCIRGLLLGVYESIKVSFIDLIFLSFEKCVILRFRNIIISPPLNLGHLSGSASPRRIAPQIDCIAMTDLGLPSQFGSSYGKQSESNPLRGQRDVGKFENSTRHMLSLREIQEMISLKQPAVPRRQAVTCCIVRTQIDDLV